MATTFRSIQPKIPIAVLAKNPIAAVEQRMRRFGGDVVTQMARYPAQQATTYRRTGTLGRNWRYRFTRTSGRIVVEVYNSTDYAQFVQGPQGIQARRMAGKGWQRIDQIGGRVWDDCRADIAQLFHNAH